MSFWKLVKEEISRIANIKDPEEALEEIKKLYKILSKAKIEVRKRGNYAYFYEMEAYYDKEVKEKRARVIESLGRINIEDYEKDPDKFRNMSKKELKKILEQY